jgi:TonB family protein
MFKSLHPAISKRHTASLSVSLALHFLFLAWVLHPPAPIFVAPSAVVQGYSGNSLTPIYFGGQTGVTQEHPGHLTWQRRARIEKAHRLAPPLAKAEAGNEMRASLAPNEHPAGSPYGSLSYGMFAGPEIRPALPISSPDPILDAEVRSSTQGDVIIEVTIDAQGNVVQTIVLQSLGPAIDQSVLTALEKWHFTPASRNGVPIPSKQDVYYHFPR